LKTPGSSNSKVLSLDKINLASPNMKNSCHNNSAPPTNPTIMKTRETNWECNFIVEYIVETNIWSREISLDGVESTSDEECCVAINRQWVVSFVHSPYCTEKKNTRSTCIYSLKRRKLQVNNRHRWENPPDKRSRTIRNWFNSPKWIPKPSTQGHGREKKRRRKSKRKESTTLPGCPTIYEQVILLLMSAVPIFFHPSTV